MNIAEFLRTFWSDDKVGVLALLIAMDFLLGVIAALKMGVFRLAYVADFLRQDVIYKIGGYLVLYGGSIYAGQEDFLVDGLDLGVAAGAAYVLIIAAMVGSIANSVREIGFAPADNTSHNPVDMVTADENVNEP